MFDDYYITDNATEITVGDRINYIHKSEKRFFWDIPHEIVEVSEYQFKVRREESVQNDRGNNPSGLHAWSKNQRGLVWIWAVFPRMNDYKEDQPLLEDDDL